MVCMFLRFLILAIYDDPIFILDMVKLPYSCVCLYVLSVTFQGNGSKQGSH